MLRVGVGRSRRGNIKASAAPVNVTFPDPAGAIVYMSPTGNDANNGSTQALAVKTLNRAAQLVSPGHTVVVAGGTYTGAQSFWAQGTAGSPITIQPAKGATPIFDGTGTAANTTLVDIGGAYVTFQGFEVKNATRTGIQMWETQNNKLRYNKVHTCIKGGIWVGGSAPAVASNTSASRNNTIEYNEVWDCVRENVGQALGSGGWAVSVQICNSDNSIIQNNKVYDSFGEGIGILGCIGGKILNNKVYDAFSVNYYLDNAQSAVCQGNVSYHNSKTAYYRSGQGAAFGIIICNEVTDRQLPSSGLNVTNNIVAGSAKQVEYSTFGANTGLVSSTITPNTYYATPAEYLATV